MDEARSLFLEVMASADGNKISKAHMYEVASLKRDLASWLEDLQRSDKKKQFDLANTAIRGLFDKIPDIESEGEVKLVDVVVEADASESTNIRSQREVILKNAKKQVGVPYKYAGNDSKGFDCSGFTSYVLKQNDLVVPRRAVDQYNGSRKLKRRSVQQGDLVFFDSGAGVNHVGIIVSGKGEPLTMIHASSSKGIVITNIETSSYWSQRLAGFGTFIK